MAGKSTEKDLQEFFSNIDADVHLILILILELLFNLYTSRSNIDLDQSKYSIFLMSLINKDFTNIDDFKGFVYEFLLSNNLDVKEKKAFPKDYAPNNKILTKQQECELSLYFAIKHCQHAYYKEDFNYNLSRANFLYGVCVGLTGNYKSPWLASYFTHKEAHKLGGDVLKDKSALAKSQLLTLWNDRFNNLSLKKKGKAEFARFIYDNPHLLIDNNGNMLKKSNGEPWYTSPESITRLLPK